MRGLRAILSAIALLAGAPAAAQDAARAVATSPGPNRVAVTVYRDPERGPDTALQPDWLNGFALISETRTVTIPAGETELRFEGVAGGILPESAIVAGLPDGLIEKNYDAWLLSPSSLLDRSLGRRVHLRRTSRATGAIVEQEAVIRSGAGGAVVLETADGIEALRCTGLGETIVYPDVPAGLASRPTLSVRARSAAPVTASITLSYLASGFDWQANYVLDLSEDGRSVALFAWLTLASSDETSFVQAETQAVAGRLNREASDRYRRDRPEPQLALRCWPSARTSDVPLTVVQDEEFALSGQIGSEDIMVTGSRIARRALAAQEELGDLKLYRLPEPVTVASNSQKQVAMIERPRVRVSTVFRSRIDLDGGTQDELAIRRLLVTRNRTAEGLGLPLPAGQVVLFGSGRERPLLLGEGSIRDHAVGEAVEIDVGAVPGITARLVEEEAAEGARETDFVLSVTSDRDRPVAYQAEFVLPDGARLVGPRRLGERNGRPLWSVTVPANGEASLRLRLDRAPTRDED